MSDNHELMAAVELAAKAYHAELLRGSGLDRDKARGYITGRRLFRPMVELFGIGYVPKTRTPMVLRAVPDQKLLKEAGILREAKDGTLYDPMAGRVVFPQVNPAGKYLGFVGRALDGSAPDKYLSTPTTPIFRRLRVRLSPFLPAWRAP